MKAMFFDLQGTLGGEFMGDIRDFSFFPRAKEALKVAKDNGYLVFIITNQSRIAKKLFDFEEYKEYENKIITEINSYGIKLDGFECCPHNSGECSCKKPDTGMIDKIMKNHMIDLKESYIFGDMGISDMLLAKNIGSKSVMVLTGGGKGSMTEYRHTWSEMEPTMVVKDVFEGVEVIVTGMRR